MSFLNNLRLIPGTQFSSIVTFARNDKTVLFQSICYRKFGFGAKTQNLSYSVLLRKSKQHSLKFYPPSPFTSLTDSVRSPFFHKIIRTFFEPTGGEINTNVSKDVLLFEYKNEKLYRTVKYFAYTQLLVWGVVSYNCYTTLKDTPIVDDGTRELKAWEKVNLGQNWVRNGITAICVLMGAGLFTISYIITARTVKELILHKGGRQISLVTYGFLGNKTLRVPLPLVSCKVGRTNDPQHLPLKVKGRTLHYTLDKKGTYFHPALFDWTAGLNRGWLK